MAIEAERGCGYRKVGALYLCGGYSNIPCDRFPLPIGSCPVCGQGIHLTRAFTEINPLRLFGIHQPCADLYRPCYVCDPKDECAFIMMVGSKYYTPESFLNEAKFLGISKKIPFIPKNLELGRTVVYLGHPKAVAERQSVALQQALAIVGSEGSPQQERLLETERVEHHPGIFCAFIPQRVEKLIWEPEATPEEVERLHKRGITAIPVPRGEVDHL